MSEEDHNVTRTQEHAHLLSRLSNIPIIGSIVRALESYGKMIIYRREFRWIWLSGVVSTIGNFFTHIAAITIIERAFLEDSTNSGLAISSVFLASYIPPILLMPFTGVVADLLDRRKVMLLSDILRMFLVLCFLFVLIDPVQLYWIIYVVLSVMWSFNSFFDPCREGLIPLVVPKNELITANALESLTWMCCSFLGSFLGGMTTSFIGVGANFIIDAITFLLSSILVAQLFRYKSLQPEEIKKSLLRIAKREVIEADQQQMAEEVEQEQQTELLNSTEQSTIQVGDAEQMGSNPDSTEDPVIVSIPKNQGGIFKQILHQILEFYIGIKFLIRKRYILSLIFIKASGAINWASLDFVTMKMCFEVFQPQGVIQDAAWTYGIYRAMVGMISGLFPVLVERLLPVNYTAKTMRLIVVFCFCCFVLAYLVILLTQSIYAYFSAAAILAACGGVLWIFSTSILQIVCPNNFMGRVMAMDIGFNLNISQTAMFLIYGPILYDILHLSPFIFSIVQVTTAALFAIIWMLWFFATRNIENKLVPVDDKGNDIIKKVGTEGLEFNDGLPSKPIE